MLKRKEFILGAAVGLTFAAAATAGGVISWPGAPAAPAAAQAGHDVTVRPVDAANAATYGAELALALRALPAGSTALVVGHSNTVPGIVAALSGEAAPEMPETEHDRYTVIVLDADGKARVFVSTY